MPGFKVDVDLGQAVAGIRKGAERGVKLAVEHLLTEANKHVPHDEGTLERSGETGTQATGEKVRGSVSYDTPYAVRQHEDMTLHHDGKGQSKWLENTMASEADTVRAIIGTAIRQEVES